MNSNERYTLTLKLLIMILPAVGVLGLIISLIIGQTSLTLLGVYLAIPMVFAPLLFRKLCTKKYEMSSINDIYFKMLLIIFLFLYSTSVIILYNFEVRPIYYYLIVTVLATTVLIEILSFDVSKKKYVILTQLMMLILNIIWSVTLKYEFFFGRTDTFGHVWLVTNLINSGYVTKVFDMYQSFPLWHILCVSFYYILGIEIPVQKTMFFLSGIVYSFLILGIYLLSDSIFNDEKIALLSSFFAATNQIIIFYGMYSISRSVVLFFEVVLIYLICKKNKNELFELLILLFTLTTILYHTASMPFIITLLLLIYLLEKIYKSWDNKIKKLDYILLSCVMTIAYWMYCSIPLFKVIIERISSSPTSGALTTSINTPMNELFNYLQYSPLLFLLIFGILAAVQSKRISSFGKTISLIGLFSIALYFPGPALLLDKLSKNFNIMRFDEYTAPIVCVVSAVGLYSIYYKITKRYLKFIVIILVMMLSILSISNDFVASDNPLVKRPFYTYYLTEDEITSLDQIAYMSNGYLISDYITGNYLRNSPNKSKFQLLQVSKDNMTFLTNSKEDLIIIRDKELSKRPLKLYVSKTDKFLLNAGWMYSLDYYNKDLPLWNSVKRYHKIYNSNSITAYN